MLIFLHKIFSTAWFNIVLFSVCAVPIILSFTKERRKRRDWIYCRIAFVLMVFTRVIQIVFNPLMPHGKIHVVSAIVAICVIVVIVLMYKAYNGKENR